MTDELKAKHTFMPPDAFERFKREVAKLFVDRPDFDGMEVLIFTSDEYRDSLVDKHFKERKPTDD